MPTPSESAVGPDTIRDTIDVRRFPWIRPLVAAHASDYATVSALFSGDPGATTAWSDAIARVTAHDRDRATLSAVVARQLESRQAPQAAREAAARLADPRAVAVVTGQQTGVFGGPLYTLLKAATAVQLAREVTVRHGVPAVPVFWVEAEDHDWEEVSAATVLDRDFEPVHVALAPPDGAGTRPAGALVLDAGVETTIAALEAALPSSEFTGDVMAALRRAYTPGARMGTAFATWMDALVGDLGMVVFEADDVAAKPLVADLFRRELEAPGQTSRLVQQASETMRALGHAPQIDPQDDTVHLFYLDGQGRRALRLRDGQYVVGETAHAPATLAAEAAAHPERFSPNVALRPLVQDQLFPTVCYVAGPSELAYQAQLSGVYAALGVPAPLLQSRASATLLDTACARFLDRHPIPFEALQGKDDATLNQVLASHLPPSIERTLDAVDRSVTACADELRTAASGIDPTLAGAVDTTVERVRDTLKTLQHKIIQASKRKDETLRRQFTRTRALTFPEGTPQERALSATFFVNRYGLGLAGRLVEILPTGAGAHYLITL